MLNSSSLPYRFIDVTLVAQLNVPRYIDMYDQAGCPTLSGRDRGRGKGRGTDPFVDLSVSRVPNTGRMLHSIELPFSNFFVAARLINILFLGLSAHLISFIFLLLHKLFSTRPTQLLQNSCFVYKIICFHKRTLRNISPHPRLTMSRSTLTISDAIKGRGSLHLLSDDVEISDALVQDIVSDAILHSPTPFNCQSGRAVVLLKEEHKKFWDLAHDVAKASVAPPIFEKVFGPRIQMFRAAYGSVSLARPSLDDYVDMRVCPDLVLRECQRSESGAGENAHDKRQDPPM